MSSLFLSFLSVEGLRSRGCGPPDSLPRLLRPAPASLKFIVPHAPADERARFLLVAVARSAVPRAAFPPPSLSHPLSRPAHRPHSALALPAPPRGDSPCHR